MWSMLPSLQPFVEQFQGLFTAPSYVTHCTLVLNWIMCPGPRTLLRVFLSSQGTLHDFSGPHGQDSSYNFFERSAWTPTELYHRLAFFVFTHLCPSGIIKLVTDDTLLHKRGLHVFGKGWFRDAVASTRQRVATASGHNWVVLAVVFEVPLLPIVLALPIMARLHQSGEGHLSCAQLAREMIEELLRRFPERTFLLLGDGGYSNSELLDGLDGLGERLHYIGRMRADAALYDPQVPEQPSSKRGRKPQKGPKLPSPRAVAQQAVPPGQAGTYQWQAVTVQAYGLERLLWACTWVALWPAVLGYRSVRVVVVHDPEGVMEDCYLLATNRDMAVADIIRNFSLRWSIEVLFKASKQIMGIQDPQHYCEASVQKVAPWVWGLQTLISVWYVLAGRYEPEAEEIRQHLGEWDSEWSLANMLRVLRRALLNQAITAHSGSEAELRELLEQWKNWVHLAT